MKIPYEYKFCKKCSTDKCILEFRYKSKKDHNRKQTYWYYNSYCIICENKINKLKASDPQEKERRKEYQKSEKRIIYYQSEKYLLKVAERNSKNREKYISKKKPKEEKQPKIKTEEQILHLKEYKKEYAARNKEKLDRIKKDWYENNKEIIKLKNKNKPIDETRKKARDRYHEVSKKILITK